MRDKGALLISINAALGLVVTTASLFGATIPTNDPAASFRAYLTSTPYVRDISYARSGNFSIDLTNPRKPQIPSGFLHYEGAYQPTSAFVKRVLAPGSSIISGVEDGYVTGYSSNCFWNVGRKQSVVHLSFHNSSATNALKEGPEFYSTQLVDELTDVLRLGINHLAFGTLRWIDADRFVADSAAFGRMTGSILTYTDTGLPQHLTYSFASFPSQTQSVFYAYKPGRHFPPWEIVTPVGEVANVQRRTNLILQVDIGTDTPAGTYLPSNFVTSSIPPTTILYTNGLAYQILTNGSFALLAAGERNLDKLFPKRRSWPVVVFALGAATILLSCLKLARRGKETH